VLTVYRVLTVDFPLKIYDVKHFVTKQRGTQEAAATAYMKLSDGVNSVHEGASMGRVTGMMVETMGVLTVEHASRTLR
jgi:hypothetical protein